MMNFVKMKVFGARVVLELDHYAKRPFDVVYSERKEYDIDRSSLSMHRELIRSFC
jgi:hypothetical protein